MNTNQTSEDDHILSKFLEEFKFKFNQLIQQNSIVLNMLTTIRNVTPPTPQWATSDEEKPMVIAAHLAKVFTPINYEIDIDTEQQLFNILLNISEIEVITPKEVQIETNHFNLWKTSGVDKITQEMMNRMDRSALNDLYI